MMKSWNWLQAGSLIFFLGCGASTGSDSGSGSQSESPTVQFQKPSRLQVSEDANLGVVQDLIVSDFNSDSFPDLIFLTSQGIYTRLNEEGTTWGELNPVTASLGGSYTAGAISGTTLLAARQNQGVESYTGVSTLSSQFSTSAVVESMAVGGTLLLAGTSTGAHFGLTISSSLGTAGVSISTTPADGVLVRSARLLSSNRVVFALGSPSGSVPMEFRHSSDGSSFDQIGSFSRESTTDLRDFAFADMTGSSLPDLIVATESGIEIFENSGDLNFSEESSISSSEIDLSARSIAVERFSPGDLYDILLTFSNRTSRLFTQAGTLNFTEVTDTAFGSLSRRSGPIRAFATDIDNDGRPYDIVEFFSDGEVQVFINIEDTVPD